MLPADLFNPETKFYFLSRQPSCLEVEVINKDKHNQPWNRKESSLIKTSRKEPSNK